MTQKSGDRSAFWPAIEKKYGEPMSYWFTQMERVKDKKYPEMMEFLMEGYGFSRAHANALVQFTRGSTSSKRHNSMDDFLKTVDPTQQKTIKAMFKAIQTKHPQMKQVIAWNKPMLQLGDDYIFSAAATKGYLLIATFEKDFVKRHAALLKDYPTNLKTIQVPSDWKVDAKLLNALVAGRLQEIKDAAAKKAPAKKVAKAPAKKVTKKTPAKKSAAKKK